MRHQGGAPRRSRLVDASPVYYGWVVVFASTVGIAMTMPGQTPGVSVFLDRIIADLDLSRSSVSAAYALATLVGSLTLPFVGRYIDRRGPRRSVVLIVVAFSLACVLMGFVSGIVTLFLAFTLLRAFGQGALGLVSIHGVNIWFVRRRGLAVGIAGTGMAVATALVPGAIDALIERVDWRTAYMILGGVVAAVMLPVGGGLYRGRPELHGLLPDGGAPSRVRAPKPDEVDLDLPAARRTLTFWLYVTGGFLTSSLGTGMLFHHYSIMDGGGIGRTTASTMFATLGLVAASTGLVTGFLMDRVPPRFLLAVSMAFLGSAMLAATRIATPGAVLGYGAVLGGMQGMSQAVQASVYAHYFGRRHIGAIKGVASTVTIAASAVGPLLLAVGFEATGSYQPVLTATALIPLSLAAVTPFLVLKRGGVIR
jgi:MFS transporter, OFA family, oxalate/formate antiporter